MAYRNKQDYRSRQTACDFCREELSGEQSRFCSQSCRVKYRYHGGPAPAFGTCELCGEPFKLQSPRQRRCDRREDTEPGDRCWELQAAEVRAERAAEEARDFTECQRCGEVVEYWGTGRRPKYCSDACRWKAARERKRAKTNADGAAQRTPSASANSRTHNK